MADDTRNSTPEAPRSDATESGTGPNAGERIRVLLLDDDPAHLLLRTAVLRQHGYECLPAASIEEADALLDSVDVAVLDYHLGEGKFGTVVAERLRSRHPSVPIIILSATLEHRFGGPEDMHLLKGYSSIHDLLSALRSLTAKQRGSPVLVDAREFYYSRIAMAIGVDVLVQILDVQANWLYVNDSAAAYLGRPREWFAGRNLFHDMGKTIRDWREVLQTVGSTRETYIDRTRRGLLQDVREGEEDATWSVLAFPIVLHDGGMGVVLSARILG